MKLLLKRGETKQSKSIEILREGDPHGKESEETGRARGSNKETKAQGRGKRKK